MTIHELLQAAGLTAIDEIPIWDVDGTGEPTKKITAQQLATAVVALANLVTGVKGNSEQNYRHGDVNLTPANIGALAKEIDRNTFTDLNNTALVGHAVLSNTGWSNMPPGMTSGEKWYEVYMFGYIQMAICYSERGAFWVRTSTNGAWTNWQLVGGPTISGTATASSAATIDYQELRRSGNVVTFKIRLHMTASIPGTSGLLCTLPDGFRPSNSVRIHLMSNVFDNSMDVALSYHYVGSINTSGQVLTGYGSIALASGKYVIIDTTYLI